MGISTNKFIVSLCNGYNKIANFIRKDKDVISVIISFCARFVNKKRVK